MQIPKLDADNIDNIEIVAENAANAATNADNLLIQQMQTIIVNAEIANEKLAEVVMSYDNGRQCRNE